MMIEKDSLAPDFELQDENGVLHKLSNYLGAPLILYFYPRDDTPGCTTEACNFRDDYSSYLDAGVTIIGVSTDSSKSHEKFKSKYNLPFTLLSDEDHLVCEKYGVWQKKKMMGREYFGIKRSTFIIDQDGKIVKIFRNVKPADHSKEVLELIQEL